MIILRLILGFGVGFCFGCAYYIGAKIRVRRLAGSLSGSSHWKVKA
jgi:hypothetical protein